MIDVPSNSVKLVEYNTIASGMGPLSEKVKVVQQYIKQKYGDRLKYNYEKLDPKNFTPEDSTYIEFADKSMDNFLDQIIDQFFTAINFYKQSQTTKFGTVYSKTNTPWVLFVIETKERNVVDQKMMEVQL